MSFLSTGPYNYNRFAQIEEDRLREKMYFAEKAKAKKLDPVGEEDDDVDNDGDVDKSDSYLKNRRDAVGKAMGKGKDKKEMKESCSPSCDCDDCKKSKKKMKEEVTGRDVIDYLMESGFCNNEVSGEVLINNMSALWLETIISEIEEGYKSLPSAKMAKQAGKAYGKEQAAAASGNQAEANKQMQRGIAMKDPQGRKIMLNKKNQG